MYACMYVCTRFRPRGPRASSLERKTMKQIYLRAPHLTGSSSMVRVDRCGIHTHNLYTHALERTNLDPKSPSASGGGPTHLPPILRAWLRSRGVVFDALWNRVQLPFRLNLPPSMAGWACSGKLCLLIVRSAYDIHTWWFVALPVMRIENNTAVATDLLRSSYLLSASGLEVQR